MEHPLKSNVFDLPTQHFLLLYYYWVKDYILDEVNFDDISQAKNARYITGLDSPRITSRARVQLSLDIPSSLFDRDGERGPLIYA